MSHTNISPLKIKLILILIGFLFIGEMAWSQTISKPIVSDVPVCKGSEIKVSFRATNGNANNANSGQLFTSSTQYQIVISDGTTSRLLATKPHGDFEVGQKEYLDFTFYLQIPETDYYQPGLNYFIEINSTNPAVSSEFPSDAFSVKSRPIPVVSNNGPICEGNALQLTASNIPNATYNWTGPNGYNATVQSPTRSNVTVAMAGTYTVTVTVNGCTSNPISTVVQVYPAINNNVITNEQISCSSFTPAALVGSTPTGGNDNYVFLWESSTSGPTTGFSAASGENAGPNYQPESLNITTWFRRKVSSADCVINISNVIEITVTNLYEWTGAAAPDPSWNNPYNWICNSLPTLETNVLIPGNLASNNYPVINAGTNALSKNFSIEAGASVIVNDNWMRIAGDLTNSGILNTETGSVSFEGSATQTIPAAAFQNSQIQNLRIDNISGVTSEAIIEVTGILKVEKGNFNTGNALTLISSAEKTALIDGAGTGEVTGLVIMQRYLDVAYGYKYFSSPFSETTAGDFTDIDLTASFPNFYRYDENRSLMLGEDRNDATGWEPITDSASALNVLEGYALNFGENTNATVVELTGVVNNGSYNRTLENNNREFTRGFHLIGNPYPSPIDWEATEGWVKTNIEDGIYFFTAGESQYTGTYTSFVNGISSTDGKSSSIIPSMQGFFVKVTDPAEGVEKVTGSLTVANKVRVTNFDQEFFKTPEQEEKPLLRLTAAFEGAANRDAMVVYFSANTGTRFNKETDAHKLMNTDASVPNLYSLSEDNINLSINAIPFPESGSYEKITLGITAERSGRMYINLADLQNIPGNWNIYIIDKEKRIGQNLRKKSTYSFSVKEGEHHDRFQLMFSKEKISDPAIAFDDMFSVDSGDFIKVNLNLEEGQKAELRVSTVTGQLLEVKEGRGKDKVEFRSITSSGIYFINLYVNDQRYSKKVLVNK